MAIGARPGSVLAMVLRQGFALAAVGLAIGGVLAAGLAVTLSGLLYGITPADPAWSLAVVTLLLAAAVANLVPARRAMRVEPMRPRTERPSGPPRGPSASSKACEGLQ